MNLFLALTASLSKVFLLNLVIAFQAAFKATLLTNFGKASLAKGIASFISVFRGIIYLSFYQEIYPIKYFRQMRSTKFCIF